MQELAQEIEGYSPGGRGEASQQKFGYKHGAFGNGRVARGLAATLEPVLVVERASATVVAIVVMCTRLGWRH